ncbi:DNA polymerase III subunit alpha [Salinicoccus roseus]|uniref:DNA polymerase III subunit alpha n=1 Tax=Salinicoccus roseus TaxID=45670 RepID=UPI000F4D8F0F|nr:DNA polymerase III subunit alpha [Salinicoccus roseus]RPE53944.1 DNA polymerase III catalytic subunit DnaE type [Salinicoccus roseus]GGA69656.1 DNA polymerase III subunit alpha [Salinicoccus roseus]
MINLNVHSCYEFLNSNIRIDQLLKKVSSDGQTAVALTDFNRLHAIYQFVSRAEHFGVKPLIGMEIAVDDQLDGIPLVLIAKNTSGYRELIRLSAMLSYKDLHYTPQNFLTKNIHNCLVIAKGASGIDVLEAVPVDPADKYASHEVSDSPFERVFMRRSHYISPEDLPAKEVLNAIRDNGRIDPEEIRNLRGADYVRTYDDLDEAERQYLGNNESLAGKCDVTLPRAERTLPHYPHADNHDSKAFLWNMLKAQLESKTDGSEPYAKRLEYEYEIIVEMGYEDYFLIVQDAVNHAKQQGIYVGPGRGSSSASLVSFLLNITEIDPLKYNLLFERFLNPERVTMPDIDIDFEDTRRDEVVSYLIEKYGEMNVAHIVTYGTLSAKMAARDVGRVLGFSDDELKMISNIIPDTPGTRLEEAFATDAFQSLVEADERYSLYASMCRKIEGLPRHTSTHAAGVLLSEDRLTDNVPVIFSEGHTLSQWPMNEVEGSGLLKIDILGLRNLSLLKNMVTRIKREDGGFSLADIPDDPDVYRLLGRGMTLGVFQLESDGIRKVIREMKPEQFLDIVAVNALYRPGPMKEIPNFIAGKRNPSTVKYPHDDIRDILKETYGVIVYQEQIMQIASRIAGYSYAEADILRRAMSKKDRETLERERGHFEQGALERGYSSNVGRHIFNLILEFADYGFPKSHAVAYSRISYMLSYIKTKFPEIFYSVILSHHYGNDMKVKQVINEVKQRQISMHPPDINRSVWSNRSEDGIQLGFSMIRGVTFRMSEAIIEARKEGPFEDIYDLKTRVKDVVLNRKVLTQLIFSGALDCFEENRKTLLQSLPMLDELNSEEYAHDSFLSTLGFNIKKEYNYADEMDDIEKIEGEKEVFGFHLSDHPIISLQKSLQYIPFSLLHQKKQGTYLVFFENIKTIRTKNGQNMAFVRISDGYQEMEGVIFPKVYFTAHPKLSHRIVAVSGRIEVRKSQPQLIIDSVEDVETFRDQYIHKSKSVVIRNAANYDISELLGAEGIPVHDFDRKEKLGNVEKSNIHKLLEHIDLADIRLLA